MLPPISHESVTDRETLTERIDTNVGGDPAIVEFRKQRSKRVAPVRAGITGTGLLLVAFIVHSVKVTDQHHVTTTQTAPTRLPEIHTRPRATSLSTHHQTVYRAKRQRRSSDRRVRSHTRLKQQQHTTLTSTHISAEVRGHPPSAPPHTSTSSPSDKSSVPTSQNSFSYLGR